MDGTLIALPALALLDSTSFGTLLIPAWLLLAPRVRPSAVLGYLLVVASAYWLLGLALVLGADALRRSLESADTAGGSRSTGLLIAQLVVGLVLLGWALLPDRWRRRRRTDGEAVGSGLLLRWRDRAAGGGGAAGLLVLAGVAVLLEAATMLPYLGAVAILAAADLPMAVQALTLTGYCLVMITPALLLVLGRVLAAHRVEPVLRRLDRWSRRAGGELVLWVAGIAGFLVAGDAAAALLR